MKVEFCELLENLKHLKNADLRKRLSAQTPLAAAKNGARGLNTSQRHFLSIHAFKFQRAALLYNK